MGRLDPAGASAGTDGDCRVPLSLVGTSLSSAVVVVVVVAAAAAVGVGGVVGVDGAGGVDGDGVGM